MHRRTLRAYSDLLRLHFAFAWPLLFCSGAVLAFAAYDGFSWSYLFTIALIGLFGFEAGMVLNDYVDRIYDRRDVESRMTGYWRPFGTRPIAEGLIPARHARNVVLLLAVAAFVLTLTLPYPHSLFVALIMGYSYAVEVFYQVKKRSQTFPVAQLVGRTDFALFPVAGYLAVGMPDGTALLYFLFFYPYALAHLAANDITDLRNDIARGMKTVPVLYGVRGTIIWIVACTVLHGIMAFLFARVLDPVAQAALFVGFLLVIAANGILLQSSGTPEAGLRALPLFHAAMAVYAGGIVLAFFV
ncbi:UbiA family prenyltransferase [Methanogenium organophilum]|uniref:UbiA family prenyltransferase n=1 Tax=Methanogenium organophilum TaxID=2199 RepID=A0A9X9S5J3_METOG|nr:UbiA family prenyltransferase [Methanogenium organophilum]WAI02329.1 UbiA family prenyltransferase [Methanogenium organophilum]